MSDKKSIKSSSFSQSKDIQITIKDLSIEPIKKDKNQSAFSTDNAINSLEIFGNVRTKSEVDSVNENVSIFSHSTHIKSTFSDERTSNRKKKKKPGFLIRR